MVVPVLVRPCLWNRVDLGHLDDVAGAELLRSVDVNGTEVTAASRVRNAAVLTLP